MNILVTGAKGFLGRNLCARLHWMRGGADPVFPELAIDEVFEFDKGMPSDLLELYCRKANFIFHFAGVNRPKRREEYWAGNVDCTQLLLNMLKKTKNSCPILYSSSIQAVKENLYGAAKRECESLIREHAARCGGKALIYRLPNLFGKWCCPSYNSVIATFCYNIAHGRPISVDTPKSLLTLAYIDDVLDEFLRALSGQEHCENDFCVVPVVYKVVLEEIAALLYRFHDHKASLMKDELLPGSFAKKLYSTYISYLPEHAVSYPLAMHCDNRGSFTELLKTPGSGQCSVNIIKPGITKGEHWHNSKWEIFIVVAGHGVIRQRNIITGELYESEVTGDDIHAVYILPGYTHNITNLSDSEDLVTVMWANEAFDPNYPDTYYEEV